jgi:hypothetical protein
LRLVPPGDQSNCSQVNYFARKVQNLQNYSREKS